jgi:hypothetical protein
MFVACGAAGLQAHRGGGHGDRTQHPAINSAAKVPVMDRTTMTATETPDLKVRRGCCQEIMTRTRGNPAEYISAPPLTGLSRAVAARLGGRGQWAASVKAEYCAVATIVRVALQRRPDGQAGQGKSQQNRMASSHVTRTFLEWVA